jgi:hypothetical protein
MTLLNRVAGVAAGAIAMALLAWASNAPVTVHDSRNAVLRLAWSARPERVEECRQQSEEELARLPRHMRQPVVCEGVAAQYRLTVRRDRTVVAVQTVRGGGLRHDRRLYVFQEVPVPAGESSIDVVFERLDTGTSKASSGPSSGAPVVPPYLAYERRLRLRPREVALITYDEERRVLVALQGSSAAGPQ